MTSVPHVTLYHAPNTRSSGVLTLLEALNANYAIAPLNFKAGEHRAAAFLQINPMGKVPTVVHDCAVITEQVAVYLYLADLFPAAGLAPAIGDPLRGPYLRWMAFYGSSFEPAVVDRSQKREQAPVGLSPYGDFDTMLNTLLAQLGRGRYLLGDHFSALDVLWGSALQWTTMFGLVPMSAEIERYLALVTQHPGFARARQIDAELLSRQQPE